MFLLASGCVPQRLTEFHNFALAGGAYVTASQVVLDQAGTATIDADSLTVIANRDGLRTTEARRSSILDEDVALQQRLLLYQQIGNHAKLLASYFQTLGALADPNASDSLGAAAQGVYDSIAKLSPSVKTANVGGVLVKDQIPPATAFVVQKIDAKSLEAELKARAPAIEREIALQEAVFTVIGNALKTDLTATLQLQETAEVVDPYATATTVPNTWPRRRREILQAKVAAEASGGAAAAAGKLRVAFIALVEKRLTEPSITELIASINSILDVAAKVQKASPGQ